MQYLYIPIFYTTNDLIVFVSKVKLVEDNPEKDSIWTMKKATLEKECQRIKELWKLNEEFFPEQYIYKYNQDGKEHRYKGNTQTNSRRQPWY